MDLEAKLRGLNAAEKTAWALLGLINGGAIGYFNAKGMLVDEKTIHTMYPAIFATGAGVVCAYIDKGLQSKKCAFKEASKNGLINGFLTGGCTLLGFGIGYIIGYHTT
jgi:hypothetical protein